ncbi:MAG TPA: TonB-dependent receptor [Steroidobacteraceae bacterium]|jgi:outer membrane receptor protein involved in Fe transport|nr:TonB-dependent receptor [Steroidobacteraceae bacterium]
MRRDAIKRVLWCMGVAGQLTWPALSRAAAGADADTTPSGTLEEVVVTAQRRTERLEDVPMSITAFSQATLDQEGLRSIDDLVRLSPGVTFMRNGMSSSGNYNDEDSDVSIRGIDSTAGASTTGIYIDDTPIQTRHLQFGTVNPYPALFDLERVEVLKGPQGTLFGAGSEGGTIRFITPEPSLDKLQVYSRAEFGQIEGGGQSYSAGLAIGAPIIDGVLGFRFSVSYQREGGWVDRVSYSRPPSVLEPDFATLYTENPVSTGVTEKNANWHDTQTARLALKWAPNDSLTVSPSLYVQTLHYNDTGAYWESLSDPADNRYANGNAQRDPSTDPWYMGAIKVDWNAPFAHVMSNTSYFSRSQHSVSDYTQWIDTVFLYNQYPPPGDFASAYFQDRQDNFTQELRISSSDPQARLTWNAGLFYSHAHENTTETILDPALAPALGLPGLPKGLTYSQPVFSLVDKQIALFGEVNFKLTDTLNFTAGVRASKMDYTGVAQESGILLGGLVVNGSNSASDKPVTPRFVLNYQPSRDSLYYASAAKGFRPGGVNTELPTACTAGLPAPIPPTFNPDSLWQYEIGTKQTLLDHRLQVNGAIYYLQWKNIQQFVYLTCGLGFVPNLGDVTGKGGDIELTWRATEDLTLGLNGSYTDSYFNGTVGLSSLGSTLNLVSGGDHLPASPWNVSANLEYVVNEMDRKPYLRLDYQYATAQRSLTPYLDPNNAPNSDTTLPGLPEIRILSVRAGVRFSGMDLSVYAQNALDYHTPTFVSRDLATSALNGYPYNFVTNYFGHGFAPRTYGVTATYRY